MFQWLFITDKCDIKVEKSDSVIVQMFKSITKICISESFEYKKEETRDLLMDFFTMRFFFVKALDKIKTQQIDCDIFHYSTDPKQPKSQKHSLNILKLH